MSDFFIITLSTAANMLHTTKEQLRPEMNRLGIKSFDWKWGDHKTRESIKTEDLNWLLCEKRKRQTDGLEEMEPFMAERLIDAIIDDKDPAFPPTVSYDPKNDTIDLHVYSNDVYWFHADRCKTNADLLGWIAHLSHKNWFSGALCSDLIKVASKRSTEITVNAGC